MNCSGSCQRLLRLVCVHNKHGDPDDVDGEPVEGQFLSLNSSLVLISISENCFGMDCNLSNFCCVEE